MLKKLKISLLLLLILTGCGNTINDASIKADLAIKAKAELDFVGVHFTVRHGIVTLDGNCATQRAFDKVNTTVKNLYGVDSVINHVQIAPVIIGTDWSLKQAVDSVLMKYPGVVAITLDSTVMLKGKVEPGKKEELITLVSSLGPKKLEEQIEIYNQ